MMTSQNMNDLITGYTKMIESYENRGWNGYLLTFTYNEMHGSRSSVADAMQDEVERVYATLLTRIVRNPRNPKNRDQLPFLLAVPDYPVYKKEKVLVRDFLINNGRHMHGFNYIAPYSRLKNGLDEHIADNRELYVGTNGRLSFIDAKPVDRTPGYVVDYIFKNMKRGLVSPDEIIVLPKAASELSD